MPPRRRSGCSRPRGEADRPPDLLEQLVSVRDAHRCSAAPAWARLGTDGSPEVLLLHEAAFFAAPRLDVPARRRLMLKPSTNQLQFRLTINCEL